MDEVKIWITGVIASCFIGVLILFFCPDSSVSGALKTVVSMFVVFSFISPLLSGSISLSSGYDLFSENENMQILSEEINAQMLSAAEFEVKQRLSDCFNDMNITFTNISVNADIDENNSIFIRDISVTLKSEMKNKKEVVEEKIREIYKIDGEVLWE